MAPAALRRLILHDYRSYADATLALDGRPVVLWGPNGAGKTNLLEAISYLAPGRGLRGASVAEVGRREPGEAQGRPWSVSAVLETPDGEARVGTGIEAVAGPASSPRVGLRPPEGDAYDKLRRPTAEVIQSPHAELVEARGDARPRQPSRRIVRLDGETVAPGRLAEVVRLVWLTPAQDRLFLEGGTERRRFLDRLVFAAEPAHAAHASAYERAMRERMRLLIDARSGAVPADPAWLDALEARLAQTGARVAEGRARTLDTLQAEIDGRADRPFPQATLGLSGDWSRAGPDFEPRLRSALAQARARDAAAGRALTGPHRTDLLVVHRERDRPAAECSTGEQKALILNLVLAQAQRLSCAESTPNPILLLDEVAAHLDARRRAALFDEIMALGLQAFLTGADPHLFAAMQGRAQAVHVEASAMSVED